MNFHISNRALQILQTILVSFALVITHPVHGYNVQQSSFESKVAPNQIDIFSNNKQILNHFPSGKATVGTVILYVYKDVPYILLARERIDGADISKAGTFSDLGGKVESDKSTFGSELLRELKEESVGLFKPTMDDLVKKSVIIHKKNNNRDIIYSIYLADSKEFLLLQNINDLRSKAMLNKDIEDAYKEKDLFVWLPVYKLINSCDQETFNMIDINGASQHIRLRKFFVNDCLKNIHFTQAVNYLTKQN